MLAFFLCASFMGVAVAECASGEVGTDVAGYGPFPTNYKEIVIKWLDTQLIDPTSARIEWFEQPKAADLGTKGEHVYGYLVHFKINSRNRFGAYTGKQTHAALIRNGEVVKGIGFGY